MGFCGMLWDEPMLSFIYERESQVRIEWQKMEQLVYFIIFGHVGHVMLSQFQIRNSNNENWDRL